MRKIFPTITTTSQSSDFNWRTKIKEINKLGLQEVALFLTCLKEKERKELYQCLKKSTVKSIPFIHLRSDMKLHELDYFVGNYATKVFNIHTRTEYPLVYDYSKYKDIIYIENTHYIFETKELEDYGGICLDFSHMENDRLLNKERFERNIEIMEKYPIGCNHISSIQKQTHIDNGENRYDSHYLNKLSDLDYLKNYPLRYFSRFIAIELENSIEEQLLAKNYIIGFLREKETREEKI